MKIAIIIPASLLVLFVVFQTYAIMSINKTEQQKYTLIKKYKGFEIRFYPSTTIATINSNAKTYKELASSGFRRLAAYIFGGNEENKNISMTAPVHMNINDSLSQMSFVIPSNYTYDKLPKPNDSSVIIQKSKEEFVAVLTFGGFASDDDLKINSNKLINFLEENNIVYLGDCRFLGYNPPYQLVDRRNEIIVAIEWNK